MDAFTTLTATAAPLYVANINTDIITPMQYIVGTAPDSMGEIAFMPWRFNEDGSEKADFVLNQKPFRDAQILIAGPNFACGSSRESAVWALKGLGIRVVIAPSFGGIFANNCYQSGILPVVLPEETVAGFVRQAEAAPHVATFTVDLQNCVVIPPQGELVPFAADTLRRAALLEGLDDLGMTKRRQAEIASFQDSDRKLRPWIYG